MFILNIYTEHFNFVLLFLLISEKKSNLLSAEYFHNDQSFSI